MIFSDEWEEIEKVIKSKKPNLEDLPSVDEIEKSLGKKIESLITDEEYKLLDELFNGRHHSYLTIYAGRKDDKTIYSDRYIDGLKLKVLVYCNLNEKNLKQIIKRLNSTNILIIDDYFIIKEDNRIKKQLYEIKYENFDESRLSKVNPNILDETGKNYEELFRERDEKYFESLLELFPVIDNQTRYKFKDKELTSKQVSIIYEEVRSITNDLIEEEPSNEEAVKALSKITDTAFSKKIGKNERKKIIELGVGDVTELEFYFVEDEGKVICNDDRHYGYIIKIKTFDVRDSSDYYYLEPSKKMLKHINSCLESTKEGKILSDFIINRNKWKERRNYFQIMPHVLNGIESTNDFVGNLGKIITYLYNRKEVSPKYKRLIKGLVDEPLS